MRQKIFIVLSIFFILFANFSFWVSDNIYDSKKFTQNVLTTFKKQEVRDAVATGIVDRILSDNPGLQQVASSPAQSAISGILNSSYLDPVIERVAGRFQQYITTGQQEVSVDLSPVNVLFSQVAKATGNIEQTPQIKNTNLVLVEANAFPKLNKWLKPITTLGPILGVIGLVILAFVIYRSVDKLLKIREIGIYLVVGVIINMLLVPFASSLIRQNTTNANSAIIASELFNTFAESYLFQLVMLGAIGLIPVLIWFFKRGSNGGSFLKKDHQVAPSESGK